MITCKIAHGVPYAAERLACFGYLLLSLFFPVEHLQFLFYDCPLANGIISWVQSLMFTVSPLCPSLLVTFFWFFGRGTASRSSVFNLSRQCCKLCLAWA